VGTIPPTGKKVNIPFVEILKIKDGKIKDYKLYFDTATMMQQLGIIAEKGTNIKGLTLGKYFLNLHLFCIKI
jgi:CTP-dependent riboflavin kinase